MARERTIVKPVNNVLYVEPNYTHSTDMYGARGLETYEMIPDLEDYSIFVNLEVEILGRTINATNKTLVLSYTSYGNKETINLMQGSKVPIGDGNYINSLTTNYTDLHLKNMKSVGASPELFGISSIDIAYRNYTVPEVTIEFVDVRGAAVFGQRELFESQRVEKAINENYHTDIQNTFFQCFFTFPYPKFRLLVKGFYGEPVTYELTCADFRARFNSDTGNFSCTAKFVGYMFSFLNDVMMNGLIAAPYSDFVGAEYWDQQKFKIKGYDGGEVDTPKLALLLKELPSKINEAEHIQKNLPEVQEKRNIESIKKELMDLKDLYVSYCEYIVKFASPTSVDGDLKVVITDSNDDKISNACVILVPSDDGSVGYSSGDNSGNTYLNFFEDPKGDIKGRIETLLGDSDAGVKSRIDEFNSNHSNRNLPKPDNILTATTKQIIYKNENDGTKYIIDKYNFNDKIKEASEPLYNALRDYTEKENKKSGENVSRYSKYQWGIFYKDNGFYDALNAVLNEVTEREKEINKTLESSLNDSLAKLLKFYPTVENMTRIVMAHFETFAYMIFKTGLLIQSENPHRTCQSLGLSADDITDVPGLSETEKEIPPFPKVTQIVEKDGIKNREESWVGVHGNKFREVDLVHGILNGISEVADIKNSGENAGGAGSETSVRSKMKIPLSPLDMIATKASYGDFSQSEPADFLSLVALRGIQAITSSNFDEWDAHCDVLGRAEAENILATEKLSNDLKSTLKDLSSSTVINMLKGQNVEGLKPSSGVWPWKNATGDTGIISNDGDFCICTAKTVFTVPYQALDWDKIKQEVFSMKSAHSEDYFDVGESAYGKSKKENVFTLETNLSRFKKIAETQMVGVDGIEYYRDKVLAEATYSSSTYSGSSLTSDASKVIANFIEGAENLQPSPDSCMLPCTSNYTEAIRLFGSGNNMNQFNEEYPGDEWEDVNGKQVKRTNGNGFNEFLEDIDTGKHTITEFPGLDINFNPTRKTSLFGEDAYYFQTDNNVKAFMFLCSLGYLYDYKSIIENEICNKTKTISIIPLPAVIYAGGVLWADKNIDKFKILNPFKSSTNTACRKKLIESLNHNIKTKLINKFEYFVKTGVKNNSRIVSFNSIREGLELKFIRKSDDYDYDDFFQNLGELEEDSWFFGKDRTWFKEGPFKNRGYNNLLKFFIGELGDSLLRNYITIDEDLGGNKTDKTVGLRLGNRDGSIGVVNAVNFALAPCIFMKNTKFIFADSPAKLNIDEGKLNNFLDAFLKRLNEEVTETPTDTSVSQADATKTSDDIKIGVYRYCKLLYDKWIGGTKEDEFNAMWTVHALFDENKEDKYFHFIDSYYNKIGQHILLNIGKFCKQVESCYLSDQYSLLSFLSAVYSDNKFNLLCVQNFMDMQKLDNMKKMFDCVPYTSGWNVRKHPNFIVQYPYEPSCHLDYDDSYENDGFMINSEDDGKSNRWPEALKSRLADADDDYNIPAFGVSYGKMYQSYFRDIDVSMDNPKVTEQTIKAQFAIASLNNDGKGSNDRSDGYTIGQDLFSIYSNNSYTCNVTMMGCAWVQPMMYFVLNNVPMFRGTYMVISVSHKIEQGDMVTKFTGVRMANVNTRIAQDCCVKGTNEHSAGGDTDMNQESLYEKLANTDNDCPYKTFPIVNPSGGNYGEPNYSSFLSGTVGAAKGNKLGSPWTDRNLSDALTAAVCAESDGTETGAIMVITTMYNRVRAYGDFKYLLNGNQYAVWKNGTADAKYKSNPSNWSTIKGYVDSVFTNGACGTFVGKEFVTPDWDLNRNHNNDLYYLKPNTKYTLSSEQVSTMWYYGFKKEWYHEFWYNGKRPDNYIRHSDCKLLAVLGTRTPQAVCSDPNLSRKLKITKPAEIVNNGDNHIDELANGFLQAINKTSQSSDVKVNIGVDGAKSNGNVLYLQSPGSNDFGKVFDIIINGYSNTVSEVRWVVPNGGDQTQPPKYLITTVEPNSTSTRIVVTSENDDNTPISDINIDENGGMNKDFCKSIVKKYRNNKQLIDTDLDPDLGEEKINKLFEIYDSNVKKCDDVVAERTGKSPGGSTVSSPGNEVKTTEWNVDAFASNLNYWRANVCEKHKPEPKARKKYGGCGLCTSVVNRALKSAGCGDKYWATYPWEVYNKMIASNSDFNEIQHGTTSSKQEFVFNSPPQKGDVCLMWCQGNHKTDSKENHFHSCGFDGNSWVSDYTQSKCNGYTGSWECTLEWHLMRHK